jgi:hypothetical protein
MITPWPNLFSLGTAITRYLPCCDARLSDSNKDNNTGNTADAMNEGSPHLMISSSIIVGIQQFLEYS